MAVDPFGLGSLSLAISTFLQRLFFRTRFAGAFFAGAVPVEAAKSAQVLAAEASFVAVEHVQGAGFVSQGAERAGEIHCGTCVVLAASGIPQFLHLRFELRFFDAPEADAAPVSG